MTKTESVQVQECPAIPLAVVRRTVRASELSRVVPECCGLVWSVLRTQEVPAGRHVAIYWDGSIRLEVGVEVAGPFAEQGDVVRSATPGGTAVSTIHYGPYQRLGDAHAAIRDWSRAQGRPLAGPNWEIYGHWQDAWNRDPSQIRTDVFYQVAATWQEQA